MAEPVLRIDSLQVALPGGADRARAVEGVSLSIEPGKTLCVVGESGSGKSVMATTVMGLLPKEVRASGGSILLNGESLLGAAPARLRAPLLRTGPRGSGQFKEISWDEALELATEWLGTVRKTDPKKLAFFTGRDQSQSLTGFWAQQWGRCLGRPLRGGRDPRGRRRQVRRRGI